MADASDSVMMTVPEEHRILASAELGQSAREILDLDAIDRSDKQAVIRITTPVLTTSFARGFIGPSVEVLGYDGFTRKYSFDATPSVKIIIESSARVAATKEPVG